MCVPMMFTMPFITCICLRINSRDVLKKITARILK